MVLRVLLNVDFSSFTSADSLSTFDLSYLYFFFHVSCFHLSACVLDPDSWSSEGKRKRLLLASPLVPVWNVAWLSPAWQCPMCVLAKDMNATLGDP